MPMMSSSMAALTSVAMMLAMMLPSFAPSLWRHHRHLRAMRTPSAALHITLFAAGYLTIWVTVAYALFALSGALPPLAPWSLGAAIAGAGAVQRSRWKAKQLARCRKSCVRAPGWRAGRSLGISCALSCAPPMTVLFVAGLMDLRMMLLITTAITAERVAPSGVRIARLTGAAALVAGLLVCVGACVRIAIPAL